MVSFMIIQAQILFPHPPRMLVYLSQFLDDQLEFPFLNLQRKLEIPSLVNHCLRTLWNQLIQSQFDEGLQ